MNNILEFNFDYYTMFYNTENSKNLCIPNDYLYLKEQYFFQNNFFEKRESNHLFPTITICLNITSNCNLKCSYCFNKNKRNVSLKFNDAKIFIDKIIENNKKARRFVIDLSGSGEPLLELNLIISIADYALLLSDKLGKEVLVSFICNGTLLSSEIANILQKKKVLFGISLDGLKIFHDKRRLFCDGKGSFDKIMNNFQAIENKMFIGAGMTFVPEDYPPIFDSYLFLNKYFETFSCRVARGEPFCKETFTYVTNEYNKLCDYLIEIIHKEKSLTLLSKIINGDDYFGRYIIKAICDANIDSRCDAGIARFSLGSDKNVYICSASVENERLCLGNIESFVNNMDKTFSSAAQCRNCSYLHICGGECKVILDNNNGKVDKYMCLFKQHLFKLSLKLCGAIYLFSSSLYDELVYIVEKILNRAFGDERLYTLFDSLKGIYSFTELKEIKDTKPLMFEELYKQYIFDVK